jgi:hypothetical protein
MAGDAMNGTQLEMTFLPFDLAEVLRDVRRRQFPGIVGEVTCAFSRDYRAIAWVECSPYPGVRGAIGINRALDRPDTPRAVIEAILQHELLHLVVPSEWEGCERVDHPERFWDRQFEVSPGARPTWEWLRRTLGRRLRHHNGVPGIVKRPVRRGRRRQRRS